MSEYERLKAQKDAILSRERADTARLDWLDANPRSIQPYIRSFGWWAKGSDITHETLRAAIDAAIKAAADKEGKP